MRYSVQPSDRIFLKRYGFLSFAKNRVKNIDEKIKKDLNGKYCQKRFDHAKQSAIDALKTISKRIVQKTAETTGDLIGNKIADAVAKLHNGRIMELSRSSPQNNPEAVTNEHNKEIPKERYISPEERQKIINDLRLV